jgi:predicted membrane protein
MICFVLLATQAIIYLPVVRPLSMFKTIFKTIVLELSSFLVFFFFSIIIFAVFFSVLSQGEAGMVVFRDSEEEADNALWERCVADEECNRFSPTDFFETAENKTGGSDVQYFGEYDANYWYMPMIWVYRSVLGDFDFVGPFAQDRSAFNTMFAWFVFFFAVFITNWIMLNLVIAIIENNYDKIKELTEAS